MNEEFQILDGLFAAAKTEAPRVSIDETMVRLEKTISPNHGDSMRNTSTFKFLIMISSISILTIAAMMMTATPNPSIPDKAGESSTLTKSISWTEHHMEDFKIEDNIEADNVQLDVPVNTATTDFGVITEKSMTSHKEESTVKEMLVFSGKANKETAASKSPGSEPNNTIIGKSRVFLIDQHTSKDQIELIQEEAERAGISFKYKTRGNGSLKKIQMEIKSEENRSIYKLAIDKKFKTQIGWIYNAESKDVRFYDRRLEIEEASKRVAGDVKSNAAKEVIELEKQLVEESMKLLVK